MYFAFFRYSIENAAHDLSILINKLHLDKYHLLGHSFGGIVAYEFLKENLSLPPKCLSIILSNTPCNMKTSLKESARLKEEMREEMFQESRETDDQISDKSISERLRKRNECRTDTVPSPLACAIENRGTMFSGPEAVSDYIAVPSPDEHELPPALLIKGEHDFINEECIKGWRNIFSCDDKRRMNIREELMENCSHYCHLENGPRFGTLVNNHCFIHDY
ncbi:hypothetical protein ACHAXS_001996 [Conticribra weissflogii]